MKYQKLSRVIERLDAEISIESRWLTTMEDLKFSEEATYQKGKIAGLGKARDEMEALNQ